METEGICCIYSSVDLGDVHIPVCESESEKLKMKSESESDVHIPVSKS